jgi:hypothetical protein
MTNAICDDAETGVIDQHAPEQEGRGRPLIVSRGRRQAAAFSVDGDPATATLNLGEAQLQFRCVDGVIEITSAHPIRIRSGRMVEIAGDTGSTLSSLATALELTPVSMNLRAEELRGRVTRTDFIGRSINAKAEQVKVTWGKCERVVGRAFDYARHAYSRVEVLLHTRAGRIRTEANGSYLVQAETARIQAKEDVRIQGTSINLG